MASGYTTDTVEAYPEGPADTSEAQAQADLEAEKKKKKKEARAKALKEVSAIMDSGGGAGGGSSDDAGLLGESTARAHRESLYGPWEKRRA